MHGEKRIWKWGKKICPIKNKCTFYHSFNTTGLDRPDRQAPAFSLLPNPATHTVTLVRPDDADGSAASLLVCDISGREVLSRTMLGTRLTLDLQAWPRGIYLLRLLSPSGESRQRLIVE